MLLVYLWSAKFHAFLAFKLVIGNRLSEGVRQWLMAIIDEERTLLVTV